MIMELERLAEGIFRVGGSVWGGLLVRDGHGLLIDAPELPPGETWEAVLETAGVTAVDGVLLTQHRRAFCVGLSDWTSLPPVRATAEEADLLARADRVWSTAHGKYHRYDCLPDRFSPFRAVPAAGDIRDGQPILWCGFRITPVVFGALSRGDCAYVAEDGETAVAFCGGLAMAGGRIHDLFSFQKVLPDMMGYHGFLGGLPGWISGAARLLSRKPRLLSPAWGSTEPNPTSCLTLLESRLRDYAAAYDEISAVRYYFPDEFARAFEAPLGLHPQFRTAETEHPQWLYRIGETTSYLLRAPSGRAILVDAGDREAVEAVEAMAAQGTLAALDGCWITHYHDDHLNAIWALTHRFDCDLMTTAAVAEVISQPRAWFLPALAECCVKCRVLADGETWQWEGFTLTALHLPGQSLYHAGLLVCRDGERILLAGDSFAPTGLDDYCADNRNLPGRGRGYRRCTALLRQHRVEKLVNQHQTAPFRCTEAYLQGLETGMDQRDAALASLLPDDAGLGLDSQWLRCLPLEQTVTAGAVLRLTLQITGHGHHTVTCRPRLPWGGCPAQSRTTPGPTTGSVVVDGPDLPADGAMVFYLPLPPDLHGTFLLPVDCWLDGRYLGSEVAALVDILPPASF